jgi:D-lactate dehydrogenase
MGWKPAAPAGARTAFGDRFSCIGASVLGGICNNSGGALVRRGPAYTELTLYARVNAAGRLELVNHLGIALGDDPER